MILDRQRPLRTGLNQRYKLPEGIDLNLELTMWGSSWQRAVWNVKTFVGNSMGGLRGGSNLASWVVAGTVAYYLWVKPAQELRQQQQEKAALAAAAAASDPYRYVEKRKPIPDLQETGLIYGNKNRKKPDEVKD